MLSSIGRSEGPNVTNPWIAKYIFPGHIPALSEVLPSVERAGLLVLTSKFYVCNMRTPSRSGESASSQIVGYLSVVTAQNLLGCGNYLAVLKWRFANWQ